MKQWPASPARLLQLLLKVHGASAPHQLHHHTAQEGLGSLANGRACEAFASQEFANGVHHTISMWLPGYEERLPIRIQLFVFITMTAGENDVAKVVALIWHKMVVAGILHSRPKFTPAI